MPVAEIGDPRLQALFGDLQDTGVRPVVRTPSKGLPTGVVLLLILAAGVVLFLLLNARRTTPAETPAETASAGAWAAPPPALYVPPAPLPVIVAPPVEVRQPAVVVAAAPVPVERAAAPQPAYVVQPVPQLAPPPTPLPQRSSAGPPLVIDAGNASAPAAAVSVADGLDGGAGPAPAARMRASALANRSMTVPQGYLIPAVLETGFDSTRPGFARAVVSRDVRGFDGRNVLIPRGSKLIGLYRATVGQGQKRAVISWNRLIRPDGMTISMEAPAVDTLGRGGIPASVNSHFLGRLGDALLQSTVEIGRLFAGRSAAGSVVVVPNGVGSAGAQIVSSGGAGNYQPTLTVPPGRSISVFVANDLDFSAAGPAR